MRRALSAYRGVVEIREARVLIGASAASQIGDWLYNAALLGYVFGATHSVAWVGAATICRLLPFVLLGPFGGAIADRHSRRAVLVAGSLVRLALMLVLAAVVASDGPVALVIGIVALASAAGAAERPAALALLPRLVGEARIGPANALLHTVQDLAVIIGPAIGAFLLAVWSAPAAFIANAATFAVAALLFATLGTHRVPVSSAWSRGAAAGILEGLRTARVTRYVLPLFALVAMVELTYGAQTVQLVVYADRSLGLGTGGYGLLLAASGVGGLASAVFNGQLATARRLTLVVVGAAVIACATQLVYPSTDILIVVLVATVAGGAGLVCCEVVERDGARARDAQLRRSAGLPGCSTPARSGRWSPARCWRRSSSTARRSTRASGSSAPRPSSWPCRAPSACAVSTQASRKRTEALAWRMALIEHLPITQGSPQLVLEQLASSSQLCPLPAGVDVVVQGSPAHAFYAIEEGRVVVHRDGVVLAHREAGESFGERGLLDNAPRNATVTTEVPTTVLRIDGGVLLDTLERAPMLTTALNRSKAAGV